MPVRILRLLDVTAVHGAAVETLPFHHKDPFDRPSISGGDASHLENALFPNYDGNAEKAASVLHTCVGSAPDT